jgi:hypothetical protein
MKPAARFLVLGLATGTILALAAAAGVIWQTDRLAHARGLDRLQAAGTAESELQAGLFRELHLRAEPLANDPAFVDYIAQSLIPSPKFGGGVDGASIGDILGERRHGFDIAIILDSKGKPAGSSGTLLKDDSSVAQEPLVAKAIATLKPTQGLWADHGQLIMVVAHPLLKTGELQGVLLACLRLDKGFANQIARVSRTGVAMFVPSATALGVSFSDGLGSWIASTPPATMQRAIKDISMSGRELTLSDGEHDRSTWVRSLDASGDRAVLVTLDSDVRSDKFIADDAMPMLYGLLGMWIVGSLLVLLQWSRTYVPLQNMMDIIERAALGDQSLTLPAAKGSPIVWCLRNVINRLLEEVSK